MCHSGAETMNQEPQFETVYQQLRAEARRQTRAEQKRRAMHDALVKRHEQTEAMLLRLRRDLSLLDQTIEAELQNSRTRDLHHFAFPMTVRALIARRDNLKSTISMLLREITNNDAERKAA
jgi:hypothetical protein